MLTEDKKNLVCTSNVITKVHKKKIGSLRFTFIEQRQSLLALLLILKKFLLQICTDLRNSYSQTKIEINAYVTSKLDHDNVLLSNTPKHVRNKPHLVQHAAAKVITKKKTLSCHPNSVRSALVTCRAVNYF